jgi:hypothetical protein
MNEVGSLASLAHGSLDSVSDPRPSDSSSIFGGLEFWCPHRGWWKPLAFKARVVQFGHGVLS